MIADIFEDIKRELRARLEHGLGVGGIAVWLACQYQDDPRDEYKRVLGELVRADDPREWLEAFCGGE